MNSTKYNGSNLNIAVLGEIPTVRENIVTFDKVSFSDLEKEKLRFEVPIKPQFLISNTRYYSFISLFIYNFILINIDISSIAIFIIIAIIGIPTLLIIFIRVFIILELLSIPDTKDIGKVDIIIIIIDINTLPLFIPNFKTKGIITDIASIADVIPVGNNISIGI